MKKLNHYANVLRKRREQLNLSQQDMRLKIGMSQQQYQRIEAAGDTRLSTLLRVLDGLDMELIFAPKEYAPQLKQQLDLFEQESSSNESIKSNSTAWQTLKDLGDD